MSRRIAYADYLESDHWKLTRKRALERAGHRCQCGLCPFQNLVDDELEETFPRTQTRLEVHHLSYERLGNEALDDLLVLCAVCHATAHGLPASPTASVSIGEVIAGWRPFRCEEATP